MIPISDVIPRRTTPVVTLALIILTAASLAGQWLLPNDGLREIIHGYGLFPAGFSWTSLLTSLFLHHGLLQAGSNMVAIWIFGASVEDRLGPVRYLAFFLLAAAAAGLMDVAARTGSPLPGLGASGGVAALVSAHFVLFPKSRSLVLVPLLFSIDLVEIPTLMLVGFWLVFQIAGGTSVFTPLAGAIAGVLLVWAFRQRAREQVEWWG
jgi:membrane associated rhomboid family serine protease